jgi:hypothetical protein
MSEQRFTGVSFAPADSSIVDRRDLAMFEAAEALRRTALSPAPSAVGHVSTLLHRAIQDEAERRPRHAAVALAVWDCLACTVDPFGTSMRRRVLWDAALALRSQFISTATEMNLLDRMTDAGLERVPPFEDSPLSQVFDEWRGDVDE